MNPINKLDHCTACVRDGHKKESCFQIIEYPEWWPSKGKNETMKHGLKTRGLIRVGYCSGGLHRMGVGRKAMVVSVDDWHRKLDHASSIKLSRIIFHFFSKILHLV